MLINRLQRTGLALCLALMVSTGCLAGKDYQGANYDSYSGFSVSEKAVLPAREVHPSLWHNANALEQLRVRIRRQSEFATLWQAVRRHRYLTLPVPATVNLKDGAKAIHKYYGHMTQIAVYNAFMVWMETDTAQRQHYLDRAMAALSRAYDGPVYQLDPRKRGVDKSIDEIYRGVWNQSLAAAYDFVAPLLTAQQNINIRERLIREAQYTYRNLDTWAAGPHNHLSKPAWGLASLALTLSDHPDAGSWFSKAMAAANRNTRYHFSRDGIYREGAQYYLFSWLNFVPFLYHYRNVSGVDLFPSFQPSMEWSLKARNGRGWMMNLEDSFIRPIPTQMVASAYMNSRSTLNPDVPFGELLQWGFRTTDFRPFDKSEATNGFNYTGASWDYPKELYELLTYNPDIRSSAPNADPTLFMAGGQTIFRNHWLDRDGKQQYLLFHGVPHADNHDHHDQLSFTLYANGQILASDQGYSRKSYGDKIRYNWYRTAQAHNTLTWNNIPLGDFKENQPAPSKHAINTGFVDFEEKSAPFRDYLKPSKGKASRAIAYIQDEYFLILDSVEAHKAGQFKLNFHAGKSTPHIGKNHTLWHYPANNYGPAAKLFTQEFSDNAKRQHHQGEGTYIKNDYGPVPFLQLSKTGREAQFAQLLFPVIGNQTLPTVENLSRKDILAAKITSVQGEDRFFKQLHTKSQTLGALSSDARFVWARSRQGTLQQWFAQSMTATSLGNQQLAESSQPLTLALRYHSDHIEGSYISEAAGQLRLYTGNQQVETLFVNDRPIEFRQEDQYIEFAFNQQGDFNITYSGE
jgi:hypothetical protein